MANKDVAESVGEGVALLLQLIFSCTTPLVILTLPPVCLGLALLCNAPEFSFWPGLAAVVWDYAKANLWAAVTGGLLMLAALPLAWVALRERETRLSAPILEWVIVGLVLWFTLWLHSVWPYTASGWQFLAYGVLLFAAWNTVVEASLSTLAIVLAHRAARRVRLPPPSHQPHGASAPQASRGEPETI